MPLVTGWLRMKNAPAPWGDYGRILVSGLTARSTADGVLAYERVGPFMPPITIAGISNLIVSDALKDLLEQSDLSGLTFQEVLKTRIVRLDWQTWDLTADEPAKYPAGDEPENYIEKRKHDPGLADQMGRIWEVVIEATVDDPGNRDLVRSAPTKFSQLLASEQAAEWLTRHASDWLSFEVNA